MPIETVSIGRHDTANIVLKPANNRLMQDQFSEKFVND